MSEVILASFSKFFFMLASSKNVIIFYRKLITILNERIIQSLIVEQRLKKILQR